MHMYGDSVAIFLAMFYADDTVIAARDPVLLQRALDTLVVGLFERVGLMTNTLKTKVMTCVPGKIRTRHSMATYNNSRVGLSTGNEWRNRRVQCDICDMELTAALLPSHLKSQPK